ncbi:protein phosphatase 2C domain-containing protein [Cytophagaceae bacterium DM2B3-1]|uniref:Protein phosphatase 2C domain-containing protein n=1 Tax=Xanthocytophaga flava TaxID=3048013 RepID=A0ABT7CP06_9BACT|nr:protein phosphatase 2C domain-containing protein [Xanthocytophaga flavus]MDJ1467624.1 protein phosphatase 2C domain-containing protein [Xanthocytophaga flavus]MDJ1494722.1 protein phosphatase 2C domain-containing protein [Xanthocytophaga flavus]
MFQKLFSALQNKPLYTTDGYTIAGKKPVNEDSYLIEVKKDACLLLVADGVGGHGHGDWASQICVQHFQEAFNRIENLNDPKTFLHEHALKVAQKVLQKHTEDPAYKNCGTTLTGFLIQEKHYYVINIGDSRTYAWHPSKGLRRLTKDHSIVQQMIDAGTLTESEAANHPYRTTMTSAIGQAMDTIKIDITGPYTLTESEMLLSFSDGVHDFLTDTQISQIISSNAKPLAQTLVEQALAAGSTDNITACWLKQ